MISFRWAIGRVFVLLSCSAALSILAPLDACGQEVPATPQIKPASLNPKDLDIAELEKRILAARTAIKTGEFEIQSDTNDPRDHSTLAWHTWLGSKDRVRCDIQRPEDTQCLIIGEELALFYFRRPGQFENPDRTKRPGVYSMDAKEARLGKESLFLFGNPLNLMLSTAQIGILHARHLNDLVAAPDRVNLEAHASTWRDEPSVIVSFVVPRTGNHFEYEAVPSEGYNIVSWHMHGELKGTVYESSESCDVARVSDDIWFPQTTSLTELRNGEVNLTETLNIKVVSVNQPIDDKIFTLAHLPAGIIVGPNPFRARTNPPTPQTQPRRPNMIWDGQTIRPLNRADIAALRKSAAVPTTRPAESH